MHHFERELKIARRVVEKLLMNKAMAYDPCIVICFLKCSIGTFIYLVKTVKNRLNSLQDNYITV
jgi:hypothetical protein